MYICKDSFLQIRAYSHSLQHGNIFWGANIQTTIDRVSEAFGTKISSFLVLFIFLPYKLDLFEITSGLKS